MGLQDIAAQRLRFDRGAVNDFQVTAISSVACVTP